VTRALTFRLRHEIRRWREEQDLGELREVSLDGGARAVRDSRRGAPADVHPLDEADAYILDASAAICPHERLAAGWRPDWKGGLAGRLDRLIGLGLVVMMGDRYLSLVLPADAVESASLTAAASGAAPSRSKTS
jgi:hypothetical protein